MAGKYQINNLKIRQQMVLYINRPHGVPRWVVYAPSGDVLDHFEKLADAKKWAVNETRYLANPEKRSYRLKRG
jgi:hypothetical protein